MNGVSVIIPVFNQEKYIAKAIDSVLQQNFPYKIELIISDDGSTDNSIKIAESYLPFIIILKKPKNVFSHGASSTRNRGINVATQPYICFLDSDDFFLQNHISNLLSILEKNPHLGFAFDRIIEVRNINGIEEYRKWTKEVIRKNDIINPVITRSNVVHTNAFMFRSVVFKIVGLFNEKYKNGEDGDLWMRISEVCPGEFVNSYGAVYRTNHSDKQLTKNNPDNIYSDSYDIFSSALIRYNKLKLKNKHRLFKLKLIILHFKFKKKTLNFIIQYIVLVLTFPYQFTRHRYEILLDFFSSQYDNLWKPFVNVE